MSDTLNMQLDLRGRGAVVCGATGGIGEATARLLAGYGCAVIAVARDPEQLAAVTESLPSASGQTHTWLAQDFDNPDQLGEKLAGVLDSLPAQILVNNTGGPPPGPLAEADSDALVTGFRHHVLCGQQMLRACLPQMRKAGYGRLINVISTSVKAPIAGLGVSNTIRGAVANWSKTLAGELGPEGFTVNNVLPGFTDTGRLRSLIEKRAQKSGQSEASVADGMRGSVPLGRFANPAETAAAIAFLASPAAAYINGINLPVDGGRTGCL